MEKKESDTFDTWNEQKKSLQQRHLFFVRERDVVLVRMGVNVGIENNGKGKYFLRPALVIRQLSKRKVLVVPLSTTKAERRFQCSFEFKDAMSIALVHQIRVIDVRRCFRFLGRVSSFTLKDVRREAVRMIDLGR